MAVIQRLDGRNGRYRPLVTQRTFVLYRGDKRQAKLITQLNSPLTVPRLDSSEGLSLVVLSTCLALILSMRALP